MSRFYFGNFGTAVFCRVSKLPNYLDKCVVKFSTTRVLTAIKLETSFFFLLTSQFFLSHFRLRNVHFFSFFQSMTLVDGTPAFDAWMESSYPTFISIYLFHLANPFDVENNGAKPIVQQKGPFVFR